MAGRPLVEAVRGTRADGSRVLSANAPRCGLATADDYDAISQWLTSDEAREVLKFLVGPELKGLAPRYYSALDLLELRALCEAEGNCIIHERLVAGHRDRGEPVPMMLTLKAEGKATQQAWGAGGMLKRWQQEARQSRNALGLNKAARARMQEEVQRQMDAFSEGDQEGEDQARQQARPVKLEAVRNKLALLKQHGLVA